MFNPGRQLNVTTTLVNSLDPDQAQQNVGPALNPTLNFFFFFFWKKEEDDFERKEKNLQMMKNQKKKNK